MHLGALLSLLINYGSIVLEQIQTNREILHLGQGNSLCAFCVVLYLKKNVVFAFGHTAGIHWEKPLSLTAIGNFLTTLPLKTFVLEPKSAF